MGSSDSELASISLPSVTLARTSRRSARSWSVCIAVSTAARACAAMASTSETSSSVHLRGTAIPTPSAVILLSCKIGARMSARRPKSTDFCAPGDELTSKTSSTTEVWPDKKASSVLYGKSNMRYSPTRDGIPSTCQSGAIVPVFSAGL